jgi:hypothetical protein
MRHCWLQQDAASASIGMSSLFHRSAHTWQGSVKDFCAAAEERVRVFALLSFFHLPLGTVGVVLTPLEQKGLHPETRDEICAK